MSKEWSPVAKVYFDIKAFCMSARVSRYNRRKWGRLKTIYEQPHLPIKPLYAVMYSDVKSFLARKFARLFSSWARRSESSSSLPSPVVE